MTSGFALSHPQQVPLQFSGTSALVENQHRWCFATIQRRDSLHRPGAPHPHILLILCALQPQSPAARLWHPPCLIRVSASEIAGNAKAKRTGKKGTRRAPSSRPAAEVMPGAAADNDSGSGGRF
jgi:hypothetical protein